ncbi:MAG: 4Fe-4S binding protein, partial [Bacteroidia bacterium]|nr:4Fe-4S binding protein [Bacteroidia bacterium]
PAVKPIALNMLKNCAQHPGVNIPISGIGGVENWRDAVEFILLGATSVQVCTAVMHYGFGIIRELVSGLERYMDEKGFQTLDDFRGKALPNIMHWEDLNLKYKVVANINKDKCIGCQLCYTACEDGAHQAIGLPGDLTDRKPFIIEENCVGCNLCSLVCPVEECIIMERRDDGTEQLTWKDRTLAGNIPKTFDDPLAGGLHHWVPKPEEALTKTKPKHYSA